MVKIAALYRQVIFEGFMKTMNKNGVFQKQRHQGSDQRLMQRMSKLTKINLEDSCQTQSILQFINLYLTTFAVALQKAVKDFL